MYCCVNEFEVGVNDGIFSGNELQEVYVVTGILTGYDSAREWYGRWYMESYQIWSFHFTNENETFLHLKYLIHMSSDMVQNVKCEILVYKTRISHINWKVAIMKINF